MAGPANAIDLASAGVVSFSGTAFSAATVTTHGTIIAASTTAVKSLGVASNGQLVIGSTGADPILGNLLSAGSTVTITNSAGGINLEVAGIVADSFATDSGTAIPASGVITFSGINPTNNGASVSFSGAGSTVSLSLVDASNDVFIGDGAGNTTFTGGGNSVAIGTLCMHNFTTANECVVIGANAGEGITSANTCTLVGYNAGASITTGSNNTVIGASNIAGGVTTGINNIVLGNNNGGSLSTTSGSNIIIGSAIAGTSGLSNAIIIGKQGTGTGLQNACTIAGIVGVTATSPNVVTINSSTGQLGALAELTVPLGGTGTNTFTAFAPVIAGTTSTGAFQSASTGLSSSGFVLTSTGASSVPTFQAIPSTAFVWNNAAASATVAAGNGYFVTAASVTLTLPASPSLGATISFAANTANPVVVQAAGTQIIQIGSSVSSAGGTATSAVSGDSLTLVYDSTNTVWMSVTAPQGVWTTA